MFPARERVILALDFPTLEASTSFLKTLNSQLDSADHPRWVKVGLELYLAEGPRVVSALRDLGYSVFLDLKLHDIPNTVAGAIHSVAALKPSLLTVHAAGGPAMLSAAAHAAAGTGIHLLAVTVLTSMDAGQLNAIGVAADPAAQVEHLASVASASGITGLVCSAQEASALRQRFPNLRLVTPGIRPAGAAIGDQQRVMTPAKAIAAGASQLVIGRPVTAALQPAEAFRAILREIESTQ